MAVASGFAEVVPEYPEGYTIIGSRYSVLNKPLAPGETFISEV